MEFVVVVVRYGIEPNLTAEFASVVFVGGDGEESANCKRAFMFASLLEADDVLVLLFKLCGKWSVFASVVVGVIGVGVECLNIGLSCVDT